MIPVTKPFVPDFKEYVDLLEDIWNRQYFTNNGPLVQQLEKSVSEYLGSVPNCYVTNGTIALQLALRALEVTGEVITTPYSYVATTSSILWEQCTPVFVDCLPNGNLDPDLIEASITDQTQAIMATHVYGYPCEVEKIEAIAKKHNLSVIYDAAHAFGVKINGKSIFDFGDMSTVSYHATKLYHTVEGGAIFASDEKLLEQIGLLRAFGHKGDVHISLGINGKQSEIHAAMGIVNLRVIDRLIQERKEKYMRYVNELGDVIQFIHPAIPAHIQYNYSYVPVLLPDASQMEEVIEKLQANGVGVRRYFYPSLNQLPYIEGAAVCPVSEDLASRVICLPMFNALTEDEQSTVITAIKSSL